MLGKYDRAIQRRIVELEENMQSTLAQEKQLQEDVQTKRQKAEEAKFSAQNSRSRNELLTRLMAQKKRGHLKGVFVFSHLFDSKPKEKNHLNVVGKGTIGRFGDDR